MTALNECEGNSGGAQRVSRLRRQVGIRDDVVDGRGIYDLGQAAPVELC